MGHNIMTSVTASSAGPSTGTAQAPALALVGQCNGVWLYGYMGGGEVAHTENLMSRQTFTSQKSQSLFFGCLQIPSHSTNSSFWQQRAGSGCVSGRARLDLAVPDRICLTEQNPLESA